MSSNAPEQQAVVVAKAASHAEVATVLADGQSAQANAQTGAKIRPASPPSAAKARKGKAKVGDKREEPTDVQRAQIAMRAAIKIQQIHRGKRGREASHAIKAVKQAEVDEVKEQGLLIKGQRVQPWSEESAKMAMMELNGKIGTNGNVLWPKGTVEKLLIERTSYSDDLKAIKQKEQQRLKAAAHAKTVADQTINEVMKTLSAESLLGSKETTYDPTWRVQDWLGSLNLTEVVSTSLLEHLRKKSADPRFERGFIQRLGKANQEEAVTIVKGILDDSEFVANIAATISKGSHVIAKEMSQASKKRTEVGNKKPSTAGKFFDEGPKVSKQGSFTLTFGDRGDFFGGLEKLVGKPDPISLRAGIFKEHTAKQDAKVEFTVGNYGTSTTSEYEYWFVVEPTPATLGKLGLREWPRDKKLYDDPDSRKLCRVPKHPRTFVNIIETINEKLRAIHQSITGDMFVGARLYTGPSASAARARTPRNLGRKRQLLIVLLTLLT